MTVEAVRRAPTDWNSTVMPSPRMRRPVGVPTRMDLATLPAPISRALEAWGAADVVSSPERKLAAPTNAVDAVDFIARTIHVGRERVFAASGVSERTFYGWKSGHTPREDKVRLLWAWVHVLSQLHTSRHELAGWFHASDEAQRAFDAGDPNAFLAAEFHMATRGRAATTPEVPRDRRDDDEPFMPQGRAFTPRRVRRTRLSPREGS